MDFIPLFQYSSAVVGPNPNTSESSLINLDLGSITVVLKLPLCRISLIFSRVLTPMPFTSLTSFSLWISNGSALIIAAARLLACALYLSCLALHMDASLNNSEEIRVLFSNCDIGKQKDFSF
ncbi:hypothetical protein GEMRC1_006998 [Eukaryota sp. GEM-RC1]